MNTIQPAVHIGVDVGKFQLDFHCHESAEHFSVSNNATGIRQALKQLSAGSIQCMVVEATGRHEQSLVQAAQRHNIPIVIAQPKTNRCTGRCGADEPGQRKDAWQTPHPGWPGPGSNGVVHGHDVCRSEQSGYQGFLSATVGQRQTQKGRAGCLHAQNADLAERNGQG